MTCNSTKQGSANITYYDVNNKLATKLVKLFSSGVGSEQYTGSATVTAIVDSTMKCKFQLMGVTPSPAEMSRKLSSTNFNVAFNYID